MNDLKLVSIIMPAYNCQSTIKSSIESVLVQTYLNWELIVIDDCSIDNTASIVNSISDHRVKYYCLDNNSGHPSIPRNFGISRANGQYIAFLDADDKWSKDKLFLQISAMLKYKVFASSGFYYRVDGQGKILSLVKGKAIITYRDMLSSNYIGNLTGIYDCKKIGKIYQKNIGHEDYLMWLDVIKETDCIVVDEIIASYLVSNKSVSSNKLKSLLWHYNILRSELGFSVLKSFFYFLRYAFNALNKRV